MRKSPFFKIVLTVVIALFIPILSYTIFQFMESDKNEDLIRSIYENQLNTILFSVNQNSSDVFNAWVSELHTSISAIIEKKVDQSLDSVCIEFIEKEEPVIGAVLQLKKGIFKSYWQKEISGDPNLYLLTWNEKKYLTQLRDSSEAVALMIQRAAGEDYIKPVVFQIEDYSITLLVFPIKIERVDSEEFLLLGLFIDDELYVDEVVARKVHTLQTTELHAGMDIVTVDLAVQNRENSTILFSTEEFPSAEFEKTVALWIIPNLDLHIKLSGTTLEDISRSRSQANLIFLGIVNLVLFLGIFYLLRNVSMQMKLAKMQTDFVANVSHELRTPLAVIRMFAETLEMGRIKTKEKKQHYYRSIMGESTRLTQLINNILDFSKISSKKQNHNPVMSSLSNIVRDTMEMYDFHLTQKGFEHNLVVEENLPELYIDPEAVKQAFLNLLENAVKFSIEKKKIEVTLVKHGVDVILNVKDYGIGIPDSEQKKIFDKFYRASNTQQYQTKGSGLGLVLVKNIMEKHRGRVMLKSKPGKGSTFSLIFPIPKGKEI
jgi:two-component system phosphate regulon sensor histidine kinase PhoR